MTAQGGDLLAWLDRAISERERTAHALGGGKITVKTYGSGAVQLEGALSFDATALHEDEVAFIAANDPESVLRHCAADRKLMVEHAQASLPPGVVFDECRICGESNEPWPCPTLVILAEGYGWTGGKR